MTTIECCLACAGDALGNVLVWNILDGTILHRLSGGQEPVEAVHWISEDIITASGAAGQLLLWDLAEPPDDGKARAPLCSVPRHPGMR